MMGKAKWVSIDCLTEIVYFLRPRKYRKWVIESILSRSDNLYILISP